MRKLFMIGCLFLLTACSGTSEREKALEKQVEELEKKIAELEQKEKPAEQEVEEESLPEIIIIDPLTDETIISFNPEERGYSTDKDKYKADLEKWAHDLARGTEEQEGYDQRMIPDKLNDDGTVKKGIPRVILDEEILVTKIMEQSERGGTVELPLTVTASGYVDADAAALNEVTVASFTTYFNSAVAGRTKNIELSAQAIDGVILGEGDIFSFNTTVGPSDEAHGYQPAEEAVNGKLVMGIGGGICQTSSTLFNAIDQLMVDYVEKHHHSVTVGYVPKGRDATVSYGGLDFRFENNAGAPLIINTIMENGALTVEIKTSKTFANSVKKKI